jgi:hypothetical protein
VEQVEERQADAASVGPEDQGRRGGLWIVWLFLALVIYVLSVGPVAKLNQTGLVPDSAEVLYYPLRVVCDCIPVFDRFIDWYLSDVWHV